MRTPVKVDPPKERKSSRKLKTFRRFVVSLAVVFVVTVVGLILWNKLVLHESTIGIVGLSMLFLGLGFVLLAIGAFLYARDAQYPAQGKLAGFILVPFVVLWFALGMFFLLVKPFPLPLGTSKLFCADWGSADVDGVVRIDPSRYSVGEAGNLRFQFQNIGDDTVTTSAIDISLDSFGSTFTTGDDGVSLGPLAFTFSTPGFQVEMTRLPLSVRPKPTILMQSALAVDGVTLKPNEMASIDIPIVAIKVGNYRLGHGGLRTELMIGTNRCANLVLGSNDFVSVVP